LYYHINIGTVKVTTTFKLALYYHNFLYYHINIGTVKVTRMYI